LDENQLRALLHRCEARAQAGDVTGFRACLTRDSGAALDLWQRKNAARIRVGLAQLDREGPRGEGVAQGSKAGAATPPLTSKRHEGAHGALADLAQRCTWAYQLAQLARAPRGDIAEIKIDGDRATFVKVVGQTRRTHFLRFEEQTWRIDLVTNPEFSARRAAFDQLVDQALVRAGQARRVLPAATRAKAN
jgi:hypothetical protein